MKLIYKDFVLIFNQKISDKFCYKDYCILEYASIKHESFYNKS